jgi:predicted nucleic acid-binding protein
MTDFWVSNASPLITLAAIDRLDIFAALYAEVRVPTTVLTEVGAGAAADRADDRVRKSGLFVIVDDVPIVTEVVRWGLDPGEAQAGLAGTRDCSEGRDP